VAIKNNEKLSEWKFGEEIAERYFKRAPFASSISVGYRFVDEFLLERILDKERVNSVVNEDIKYNEGKNIKFLQSPWIYNNDVQLNENLNEIASKLDNNKISFIYYGEIINRFGEMKEHDVLNDRVDELFGKMKNNISKYATENQSFDYHSFNSNAESYSMITALEEIVKQKETINKKDALDDCFSSSNDWGNKFYNYCREYEFKITKEIWQILNIEKIVSLIHDTTSENVLHFKYALDLIFKRTNLSEYTDKEYEKIEKLKTDLVGAELPKGYAACKVPLKWIDILLNNIIKKRRDSNAENTKVG
jgi:hypothetical protein